jgi:hypothetical protein
MSVVNVQARKATLVGLTGIEGARTIAVSHASNSRRQAP